MKTRCPACQTVFRVTPEQLKARAGKVRCGQCQFVFNALDHLLDDEHQDSPHFPHKTLDLPVEAEDPPRSGQSAEPAECSEQSPESSVTAVNSTESADNEQPSPEESHVHPEPEVAPLSEAEAQLLGKTTGLILPRETTEIPGYSKWAEGVMTSPASPSSTKVMRWPFLLAAILLLLALAGQLAFRFRSEIAITAPALRPALESLSQLFDADIPLPRHVELISIEASDLQTDPAHGNLLLLNATLRNRASYAQAYPYLELSLTDTQDAAIVRRVFLPDDYLTPKTPPEQAFAANADLSVKLWIEAKDISASGYRLYVFYP